MRGRLRQGTQAYLKIAAAWMICAQVVSAATMIRIVLCPEIDDDGMSAFNLWLLDSWNWLGVAAVALLVIGTGFAAVSIGARFRRHERLLFPDRSAMSCPGCRQRVLDDALRPCPGCA